MRAWHFVFGSVVVAGLVLGFAVLRTAETRSSSTVAPPHIYANRKPPAGHRVHQLVPSQPRRARVKPRTLRLGAPQTRSAKAPSVNVKRHPSTLRDRSAYDAPPPPPAEPTLSPEVAAIVNGPDPCVTNPPSTLDECAEMSTAAAMDACIQYRVDCYG